VENDVSAQCSDGLVFLGEIKLRYHVHH